LSAPTAPRTLPHNLEAERSVLGSILINNATFHGAAAIIRPEHFFRKAHRDIFQAIWNLADVNNEIDIVTIKAELERMGLLEDCGGPAYISSLVDGVPHSSSCVSYAEIVKDMATKCSLIKTATKIVGRAYDDDDDAAHVVTWAEQQVFDLAHGHLESNLVDLRGSGSVLMKDLEFRQLHRGQVTGVETGFQSINDLTHGWQPGDLVFIGARPSIGKTTFVMNSVVAAARAGKRIAVFSMEMKRKQLEYRILSSLSGVPLSRMLAGALGGGDSDGSDFARIAAAMEIMRDLPIYIDDRPGRTVWDIRSACRQLKADEGIDEAVVDYAQLMKGTIERKGASRNDELTDISNRFKALAGELEIPFLVLSQLARRSMDRPDPRPKMSDLKDCGAFEQDADIVALLHRKNHREGGVTNVIFEKQRNGPTGTVNITLDRDIVTFTDGGEEPPPEPKPDKPAKPKKLRY
jgi:replicative DNA helicase